MRRVLVADLLAPVGHSYFNEKIVGALESFSSVDLVAGSGMSGRVAVEASLRRDRVLEPCGAGLSGRTAFRRNVKKLTSLLSEGDFDDVVLLSADPACLLLLRPVLNKKNVYLFHHKSVDELSASLLKRALFGICGNKMIHIVGEKFIAQELVDNIGVQKDRVVVCPFPMLLPSTDAPTALADGVEALRFNIVGLSQSNDPEFVRRIAENEQATQAFASAGCKVYLKSNFSFSSKGLKVSPERLSDDVFSALLRNAEVVASPFSLAFGNRVSGTLLDAIGSGCRVVASGFSMAKEYSQRFPGLVVCENDVNMFCEKAIRLSRVGGPCKEVDELMALAVEEHSPEKISCRLEEIITGQQWRL